jgi:hypothetical protein
MRKVVLCGQEQQQGQEQGQEREREWEWEWEWEWFPDHLPPAVPCVYLQPPGLGPGVEAGMGVGVGVGAGAGESTSGNAAASAFCQPVHLRIRREGVGLFKSLEYCAGDTLPLCSLILLNRNALSGPCAICRCRMWSKKSSMTLFCMFRGSLHLNPGGRYSGLMNVDVCSASAVNGT